MDESRLGMPSSPSPGEPLHVVRLPLGRPHEAQELQRGNGLSEPRLQPHRPIVLVLVVSPVLGDDRDPTLHPVVEVDEAAALTMQLVSHAQVGQRRRDRAI